MTPALLELTQELFPADLNEVGITFNNPLVVREKIERFLQLIEEAGEKEGTLTQIKTTHRFINGLYAREVFIPKGAILIGKIHRHECMGVMLEGDKTMLTEEGVKRLKGSHTFISRPGLRRVGFAHEDTRWITFHPTTETDLEKLEEQLTVKSHDELGSLDFDSSIRITMEGKQCPSPLLP